MEAEDSTSPGLAGVMTGHYPGTSGAQTRLGRWAIAEYGGGKAVDWLGLHYCKRFSAAAAWQ